MQHDEKVAYIVESMRTALRKVIDDHPVLGLKTKAQRTVVSMEVAEILVIHYRQELSNLISRKEACCK